MFKKVTLGFAIFFGLNLYSLGFNTDTFVGFGGGISFDKQTINGVNYSKDGTDTGTLLIFKGGLIIEDYRRITFAYMPLYSSKTRISRILASFDYILPIDYSNAKFFLGAHLGMVNIEKKDLDGSNPTSAMYGGQLGLINSIARNLELEIGTMFSKYSVDKNYEKDSERVKYKLDRTISVYATINYKF